MPSALEYLPPTEKNRKGFDSELRREKSLRRKRYNMALEYYEGNHPLALELPEEKDLPDDNMTVNMVKMTVNRTSNFLFPDVPTVEIDPTVVEDTEEEKWAKDFIKANGGLAMLHKWALRGCLSGHVYVRVVPPKSNAKGVFPRIILLNPTDVMTYWRGDDIADVVWYEYRYMVGDMLHIQDVVKSDDEQSWDVYTYESTGQSSPYAEDGTPTHHGTNGSFTIDTIDWDRANFVEIKHEKHNFPIPPIIEWAHLPHPDSYYGQNEFPLDLRSLQDKINRVSSERARIVRVFSDPVDVATGTENEEIEKKDNLIMFPGQGVKVQRLELHSDLTAINDVLKHLMETYLSIAMVVLLKGEAKDLQRVTNASVRTLFIDMLAKNTLLQSAYGLGFEKVVRLGLAMGVAGGQIKKAVSELDVTVKHKPSLPVDLMEVAQINNIMIPLGARSLQTGATLMGDEWARETAQMDAETERQVEKMKAMQAAMPDQQIGPDGKPTGAPSADKQHAMNMEATSAASKAKADKGSTDSAK